jgi:hypothetical protein
MKKYTVIYATSPLDRYNSRVTSYRYIKTDDLKKTLRETPEFNEGMAVWFIFEGHCVITQD